MPIKVPVLYSGNSMAIIPSVCSGLPYTTATVAGPMESSPLILPLPLYLSLSHSHSFLFPLSSLLRLHRCNAARLASRPHGTHHTPRSAPTLAEFDILLKMSGTSTPYELLPDLTIADDPLHNTAPNAVLVVDAACPMSEALITALATGVERPSITAVTNAEAVTDHWLTRMASLRCVRVENRASWSLSEKRRLLSAHSSVFLVRHFRWYRYASGDFYPESARSAAVEVAAWIDACAQEGMRHVVYVSTASPALFQASHYRSNCLEGMHCEMERRLAEARGIQHYTILRPVSLMSALCPPPGTGFGHVDLTLVMARCDPRLPQQLIAPEDVGRIGALVLTQGGAAWHKRVVELSADQLSCEEEATVRSELLGRPVHVDTRYSTSHRSWIFCGADRLSRWAMPALVMRANVSVEETRRLLPSLMNYRAWFVHQVKRPEQVILRQSDCSVQ